MRYVQRSCLVSMVVLTWIGSSMALQADTYCIKRLVDISFQVDPDDAQLQEVLQGLRRQQIHPHQIARVVLDGEGEAYLLQNSWDLGITRRELEAIELPADQAGRNRNRLMDRTPLVAIRTPGVEAVSGWVHLDLSGTRSRWPLAQVRLPFTIPADAMGPEGESAFRAVQLGHYRRLWTRGVPGGAWWRHRVQQIEDQLGFSSATRTTAGQTGGFNEMRSTYNLLSGGLAVSENLQLRRDIPAANQPEPLRIALDSIEGITLDEFNWGELTKGKQPELDRLASAIPHDQHALLTPSADAFVTFLRGVQLYGVPLLHAAHVRGESADWVTPYLNQMLITVDQLEAWSQEQRIATAAITGGDAYFDTGTDVALLFEGAESEAIVAAVQALIRQAGSDKQGLKVGSTEYRDVAMHWAVDDRRSVSCYTARVGDVSVVANSAHQLRRLIDVYRSLEPSLAELDEFRFFRQRYSIDAEHQLAFLMISDATIRRWCSPRWRIGQSRRLRAAAVIGQAVAANHARFLEADSGGTLLPRLEGWVPGLDQVNITAAGIDSPLYGSLDFLTPIGELEFDRVTSSERDGYETWRRAYEGRWNNVFDPIGLQLQYSDEMLAGDLTVMPLINRSQYDWLETITRGAVLKPEQGDRHPEAILQAGFALNLDNEIFQSERGMIRSMLGMNVDPFGWIGDWISIYVDADPWLAELAAADDPEAFFTERGFQAPLGISIDVRSTVSLTVFLGGLRTFVDTSAPGLMKWEIHEHHGVSYVRIAPTEADPFFRDIELFYAPGNPLLISLDEATLRRGIERRIARSVEPPQESDPSEAQPSSQLPLYLGDNLNVQIDQTAMQLLNGLGRVSLQTQMQRQAWDNIPILNQWYQLYPEWDPADVHQRLFGRRLVAADQSGYRWNEQWQTMESVTFGHPGEPRAGQTLPAALQRVTHANFGLTFEPDGLRARTILKTDGPLLDPR